MNLIKDLSLFQYPLLGNNEKVYCVTNYQLFNKLNQQHSSFFLESNQSYTLKCVLMPLPNLNISKIEVELSLNKFEINYSQNTTSRGFYLIDNDNNFIKLLGPPHKDYNDNYLQEMNYLLNGLFNIYDSFYEYGITLASKDKFIISDNTLSIALDIIKIHENTMITRKQLNGFDDLIESFSLSFVANNCEFILFHLNCNIIENYKYYVYKSMKNYSIFWKDRNKTSEIENIKKINSKSLYTEEFL